MELLPYILAFNRSASLAASNFSMTLRMCFHCCLRGFCEDEHLSKSIPTRVFNADCELLSSS